MTTIDNLLLTILNNPSHSLEAQIPGRDAKVLRSLGTAVTLPNFITENQGNLLIKILSQHHKRIEPFSEDIVKALAAPTWTASFRKIEQVRKIYTSQNSEDEQVIVIEFTFSAAIRKTLTSMSSKVANLTQTASGKVYTADYTERNIVELVDRLHPLGFKIEETLQNHYDTIKSWSEEDVKNQFRITSMVNQNFQRHITNDLGIETPITQDIINDRSLRYQYFVENPENSPQNLTGIIANRDRAQVWIDSTQYSLTDLLKSLIDLKRLPVMVIFDNWEEEKTVKNLKILGNSLDEIGITDNVGIYFRLSNTAVGKEFNDLIKNRSYNKQLDNTTKIIGVQTGKLPKFFITSNWRPMSVINIGSAIRSGKTSVFARHSDLIVSYCDHKPILEKYSTW